MAQRRTADAGLTDPARRALLAAAAALPACAGTSPGSSADGRVQAPAVRVGDRWRYRIVDRYSGRWIDEPTWEVVEVGAVLRLKVTPRRASPSFALEERFASAWSTLAETVDGTPCTFADPVPWVPSPPEPGRSVTTTTTYLDPVTQRRKRWSQQLRVGGWESVEVPAGRFDCLRIGRTIAFDHPDGGRLSANRSDVLWYAPAVNRWVQRELRDGFVSGGTSPGTPSVGELGREDWVLHQLTAHLPASATR